MAQAPDPNRHPETDPELSGHEERSGGGIGSPKSTRLGLSSGAIAGIAVLLVLMLLYILA